LSARILLSGCEDFSFERAATFARAATAFPMQTDTPAAVAGVVPIELNESSADERCFSLFAVIAAYLPNDRRAGSMMPTASRSNRLLF
jgi:hypothetical protein